MVHVGWGEITGHLDSGTCGLGGDNGSSGQWYVWAGWEITGHLDSGTLGLGGDNGSSGQWYVWAGGR